MTDRSPRVLVVDDSAVTRFAITGLLEGRGMEVVTAPDPVAALARLPIARPDVLVLDLLMPRMDGMTFLRRLMADSPLPVVVCSAATGRGSAAAIHALEEGAVAVLDKATLLSRPDELGDAVLAAARARVHPRGARTDASTPPPADVTRVHRGDRRVLALAASTGGPEALTTVLRAFPADAPPTLVVQHMPAGFTRAFAERLDALCAVEVREARAGDALRPGLVLLAPGDRHLELRRSAGGWAAALSEGPPVSRHRPSADVLFRSVAREAGARAAGALLTGMGVDGADGLAEMRLAGAHTVAQDEASCVVYGMPREAVIRGAAASVVPLHRIAGELLSARAAARVGG